MEFSLQKSNQTKDRVLAIEKKNDQILIRLIYESIKNAI